MVRPTTALPVVKDQAERTYQTNDAIRRQIQAEFPTRSTASLENRFRHLKSCPADSKPGSFDSTPWVPQETEQLLELRLQGLSIKAIARITGRTSGSINTKLETLSIHRRPPTRNRWTKAEDSILRRMRDDGTSFPKIVGALPTLRSANALKHRYYRLRDAPITKEKKSGAM